MKQRISKKQWHQLSRKAKGIWNDWCKKSKWQPVAFSKDYSISIVTGLPIIGQLIEFLDENATVIISSDDTKSKTNWCANGYLAVELCDALWGKTKEKLNENK